MTSTHRLSLHSMLRWLHSREASAVVAQVLESAVQAHGGTLAKVLPTSRWPELPRTDPHTDTFERTLGELLAHHYTAQGPQYNVPRAVVAAYAQAADANGYLALDGLENTLGASAKALALKIVEAMEQPTVVRPTNRHKTMYSRFRRALRTQLARSADQRENLRNRMGLLDDLRYLLGGFSLAGRKMVTVQHIFPTTPILMDELAYYALDRKETKILGKRYSTHAEGFVQLEAGEWHVDPRSLDGQVQEARTLPNPRSNDEHMRVMAKDALAATFADIPDPTTYRGPRIMLLDEGGFLIEALYRDFPEYARHCIAIETTENGMLRWEALEKEGFRLEGPLIDLARCDAKKLLGGAAFGESCVHAIDKQLAMMNQQLSLATGPRDAAVIGFGSMGSGVIESLLRRGYERKDIYVHDTDPAMMRAAHEAGHPVGSLDEVLAHGHLLISGTGTTALTPERYDLLPDGAVLANVGSGRHELLASPHLLSGGEYGPCTRITETDYQDDRSYGVFRGLRVLLSDEPALDVMRHELVRTPSGKDLLMLRRGYVVNMDLGTPPEFVQLLFGLVLVAVDQATRETRNEIVPLSAEGQLAVTRRFEARLAEARLSADAPDYRKVARWTT